MSPKASSQTKARALISDLQTFVSVEAERRTKHGGDPFVLLLIQQFMGILQAFLDEYYA